MRAKTLLTSTATVPLETLELPVDPALPGYASLRQPSQLKATLARVLDHWLGPEVHLLNSRAYLRRLFPGKRCSVELELVIEHKDGVMEDRRLLGKLYNEDQAVTVYRTLRELGRHGLRSGRFLVPQAVACVPEHRLLLLTWTEGELLSSVFVAGVGTNQEAAGAAEWLLRLHSCGVNTGRRYSFSDHLRTLASWKELLTEVYPEGEGLLGALLARFEERTRELSGWIPGPTHRDFTPEHLVVDGDRFTCLDFDEFCQYDRLFDVAHFAAHLGLLGLTHFGALNHFDSLV
ncbi:MAG TPA: phosphotransferase, partial [Terracidiphilus sp.]|nr:phosphotransferase [Terracidiphilus sp.]